METKVGGHSQIDPEAVDFVCTSLVSPLPHHASLVFQLAVS